MNWLRFKMSWVISFFRSLNPKSKKLTIKKFLIAGFLTPILFIIGAISTKEPNSYFELGCWFVAWWFFFDFWRVASKLDKALNRHPICSTCLIQSIYVGKWDTYGCFKCNSWIELECKCGPTCKFDKRPVTPFGDLNEN